MEKKIPVVVIRELSETDKILSALKAHGILCAEITFRTACAEEALRLACRNYPEMDVEADTVINGKTVSAPEVPAYDGYTFVGWYTDTTYMTPFLFDAQPVTGDMISPRKMRANMSLR